MNVIAAAPGWRSLAVWAMPPVAYALASDTLIGVLPQLGDRPAQAPERDRSPPTKSPRSRCSAAWCCGCFGSAWPRPPRCAGFRAWVLEECPIAPGRRANSPAQAVAAAASPRAIGQPRRGRGPRADTKSARFLALVTEHHGPLAGDPAGQRGDDLRRPRAPSRPQHRRRQDRTAPRRPRRPRSQRRPLDDDQVRHRTSRPARRGRVRCRGRSCPHGTCRTTAPDTYDSASACGCTPAKASLRSSAFGCTGAAWQRCAAPAGSVAPFPSGCASLTRMHIRCS